MFTGRSIPVVRLVWDQVDRVRFSAPRIRERSERITAESRKAKPADSAASELGPEPLSIWEPSVLHFKEFYQTGLAYRM